MALPILSCSACGGEGRILKSRHGGNDPDVWDAGPCEACDGSGHQNCERKGCEGKAIAFTEDHEALCAPCLSEWQIKTYGESELP